MRSRHHPNRAHRDAGPPDRRGTTGSFREALDAGMAEAGRQGDWKRWLGNALETGDPHFWPQIRKLYQERPDCRWSILFHLPIYWRDYENMVAPLLRVALLDPERCDQAIEAVESFPSLAEDAVAALSDPDCLRRMHLSLPQAIACLKRHPDKAVALLRNALPDPRYSRDPDAACTRLALAAALPALVDDVAGLKDPEYVRRVGLDPILGCLACQFGLTEGSADQIHTEWGWQGPLLDGVRAELQRRYSVDLDRLMPES